MTLQNPQRGVIDELGWAGTRVGGLDVEAVVVEGDRHLGYRARMRTGEPARVDALIVRVEGDEAFEHARAELSTFVRLRREIERESTAIPPLLGFGHQRLDDERVVLWLSTPTFESTLQGESARAPLEAIATLHPVATALAAAHARGIAHLSLSPSAIARTGGVQARSLLLDLGHAHLLTTTHARKTPPRSHAMHYAAPEQVDATLGHAGPPADVFALSLLFMELVVGTSVFGAIDPGEYWLRLVDRTRRPSLRDHGIGVASSIERALSRSLSVDPSARPPDAATFWRELAEAVRAAPTSYRLSTPEVHSIAEKQGETATTKKKKKAHTTHGAERWAIVAAIALGASVFGVETFLGRRGEEVATTASAPTTASTAPPMASPSSTLVANAPSTSASIEPPAAPPDVIAVHDRARVFRVDRTEVTVAAFDGCVVKGKCKATREFGYGYDAHDPLRKWYLCNEHVPGREHHPINCVTFTQADAYCTFAGGRLPTEREFELAASNGNHQRFPWGNDPPSCERAVFARYGEEQWGCKKQPVGTAPVDDHPDGASALGIVDLAGNVWEWTGTQLGGGLGVLRGGGWDSGEKAIAIDARLEQAIYNGDVNVGFRCVRD